MAKASSQVIPLSPKDAREVTTSHSQPDKPVVAIRAKRLTQQQLETHLWGAANILRGKTAGQDYKNYILSLMFFKRLCDQWGHEADEAIAEQERLTGRQFTEQQKAV